MNETSVLVIDDEDGIRETLSLIFEDEGFSVSVASSAEEGLEFLSKNAPDVIFLDIWLPGMDGIDALEEIRRLYTAIPVIIISGHGKIEQAVKATKMGAYDFLEKPLSLERVILSAKRAIEHKELIMQNEMLKKDTMQKFVIIGESPAVVNLRKQIEIAGKSNARVLIMGESGAGKELVARNLHLQSDRLNKPFIEVNCVAIPQELIESELFGHEKGSFTGAFEKKKGKFELADEGTLFLDEIGDMSMTTQAKVLRVIETQEFQRVGGSKNIKVDVRIIAATNKDLHKEVKEGKFREDLYFRLNVIPIIVPPLRERRDDLPILIEHFMNTFATEYGKSPRHIEPDAMRILQGHDWPGNVRELKNTLERLFIMTQSRVIKAADVAAFNSSTVDYFAFETLKDARDSFERDYILKQLEKHKWNVSKTAETLQIERSNLHRKIKGFGIEIP
ncbi:sigma-54-dependent transcriptional regulator [Candidatus Magnetominusculus xianensis]|uniref:Sigma-54-dependent Fis family transcriptional regulator n=1 Tax=Candidatus Magnetominusculus xianensis TaxID=1748249 RepID=A0ABR5SFB5_9BACT|nr:sigma-54 dependent transcriptional regulator [Candidatus Magnetominusculus xianensis]KWT82930.1 sigma-54-dependent Fis family transcriptional regulator [Candidatus Magnetominusculus xianensis]MBF0403009.1 sigma-54-dependent Fis family transcriptional regulator [Nitrospirota bacterium]